METSSTPTAGPHLRAPHSKGVDVTVAEGDLALGGRNLPLRRLGLALARLTWGVDVQVAEGDASECRTGGSQHEGLPQSATKCRTGGCRRFKLPARKKAL